MSRAVWFMLALACAAPAAFATARDHHGDRWAEIAPPARAGHASAYDVQHRRLIVFGGKVDGPLRNDVWVLSLSGQPRWDRLRPAGEPPSPRSGSAAAYDELRDRLLLFGGRDTSGQPLDDLWELTFHGRPAWSRIGASGPHPAARWRATLTHDPVGARFILYGGQRDYFTRLGDAWTLSPERLEWRPLEVSGEPPLARCAHSAVYCPDLNGILVFGGEVRTSLADCPQCRRNQETAEIWFLRLGSNPAWRSLKATSTEGPCEMQGQVAAWDESGHRMLVFGGGNFWRACAVSYATVWSLSVPDLAWTRLTPDAPWPRARCFAAAFFDPATRSLYVHGGEGSVNGGACYADAWRLSLDSQPAWTLLAPERIPPQLRTTWQTPAVYDPLRDRVLVDGGDQLWVYDIRRSSWSPLIPSGDGPPAHSDNTAVLDTKRDRLVIYGGMLVPGPYRPFRQVWTLTLGDDPQWALLPTRGEPPETFGLGAIYDPGRDRLLAFTANARDFFEGEVWALPLGTADPPEWRQLGSQSDSLHVRPPAVAGAVVAYDSRRDRMLVFGGGFGSFDGSFTTNGCWALDLNGPPVWDLLSPPELGMIRDSLRPTPRMRGSGVYDSAGDRLIILGGAWMNGSIIFQVPDDAWALELDFNQWTRLRTETDPHPGWINPYAVYDSRRDRTMVFQNDLLWTFESGRMERHEPIAGEVEVPSSAAGSLGLELGGARPNPSAGEMNVHFTLPDAAPATLELLDLAGRRLWRQDVGALGVGAHALRVSPGRAPPGLYLLRLTRGTASLTTKVVRLRG